MLFRSPVLAVVFLGVVGTGLAQAMQYDVVRAAGATVASSVAFVIPVVAVSLGFVVLGETVGPLALAGAVLILYAAFLVTRKPVPLEPETTRSRGRWSRV